MYIDTHCHLDFPQFDPDRAIVIGNAKKANVKKFINPGVDIVSSLRASELARRHPGVIYSCVGFHPYEAQKNIRIEDLEKIITPQTVAIGECGLDYHLYKGEAAAGKKDVQKRLFENQLRIAIKRNLAVVIHCRDAFSDLFDVLDSVAGGIRGVIHCFSGGLTDVRMANERGLYLGIDGNVTYSRSLAMIVPHIPLTMLLLETDAPYLTPVPYRGMRNEPKYIPLTARRIAELKGVSPHQIHETTSKNAHSLFQIS